MGTSLGHANSTGVSSDVATTTCPGPTPEQAHPQLRPKFMTPAVLEYLENVPNVCGWADLLQNYLRFEAASPSKSVGLFFLSVRCVLSSFLSIRPPAFPPPDVLLWWVTG